MNISVSDWWKPNHLNYISKGYSLAAYSTDTQTELEDETESMLFPELKNKTNDLKVMADATVENAVSIQNRSYNTWFMGVFSNMYNAISKKLMGRAESVPYYDVVDKETSPSFWLSSKTENKNIGAHETCYKDCLDMNGDCKNTVAACEDKLNNIRHLLSSKSVPITQKPNTCRSRRPKKVFVESSSVEDNFEDAFAPEDFISHPSLQCISYIIPKQVHHLEFLEVDAPKMRVEIAPVKENTEIVSELKENELQKNCNLNNDEHISELTTDNNLPSKENDLLDKQQTIISCEEKILKLQAMLQEGCKKDTELKSNSSDSYIEPATVQSAEQPKKPPKPSANKSKDKNYKNSNRLTTERRKKSALTRTIQDELFNEDNENDDVSSLENSPRILHNICKKENMSSSVESEDYFDEITGRFHSNSGAESDDSFQVVFTDSPQRKHNWRPSDCESEDSFILFEESPDSCYTSNDVFGDETEDSDADVTESESEESDSGCDHLDELRMSHSMSKSVGDLTDNNLYVDETLVDEVDCAVRICEEISSQNIAEVCELSVIENKSTGLLLDEHKKLLRKNQPPKKVHFSEKPPKVFVMRVWAFAARLARPGHWERFAIDRERFKRRIADADMALSWVLKPQHRSRVMFQRFMPWWNKQKRLEAAEKKQREEEEKRKQKEEEEQRKKTEEENGPIEDLSLSKEVEITGSSIIEISNEDLKCMQIITDSKLVETSKVDKTPVT